MQGRGLFGGPMITHSKKTLYYTWMAASIILLHIACSPKPEYPAPRIQNSDVVIELCSIPRDRPLFFTHRRENTGIRFFVISISGKALAFLDACAECHPKKLGYEFRAGVFVCKACGVTYSAKELEHGMGSCYPIRLKAYQRGNDLRIPLPELVQHADKF